jgi:hypothetical protein
MVDQVDVEIQKAKLEEVKDLYEKHVFRRETVESKAQPKQNNIPISNDVASVISNSVQNVNSNIIPNVAVKLSNLKASEVVVQTISEPPVQQQPNSSCSLRGKEVGKEPVNKKKTTERAITRVSEQNLEEKRHKAVENYNHSKDQDTLFKELENLFSNISIDVIPKITKTRMALLGHVGTKRYDEILKSHHIRIKSFLTDKLKLTGSKLRIQLLNSFNTVEVKLIELEGFCTICTQPNDVSWYAKGISDSKHTLPDFTVLDRVNMLERMMNYSVCVLSIKDILRREMFNPHGFNSIIYVKRSKQTDEDPFCFYTLEKIDGKRSWVMDCRLHVFVQDLIDTLLPYCHDVYKKYYIKSFSDLHYRDRLWEFDYFTQQELEQLALNMAFLCNKPRVIAFVQKLVIELSTYEPTVNDKFNLQQDDKLNIRMHKNIMSEDWTPDFRSAIRQLFENDCDEYIAHILALSSRPEYSYQG